MAPRSAGAALAALVLAAAAVGREEALPLPERISRTVTVVREEDGIPIEGATVEVQDFDGGTEFRTTGKDGTAVFDESPFTGVLIVARAPGRAFDSCEVSRWAEYMKKNQWPRGDTHRSPTLRLPLGRILYGKVVSAADGRPVVGVTVEAWSYQYGDLRSRPVPCWTAVSDELGAYRTDEGVEGKHWVQARAPNWISDEFHFSDHPYRGRPPRILDLIVHPAGTLRGLVLDEVNAPAPEVSVVAVPPPGAKAPGLRNLDGRTGADGRFSLPGALVGIPYTVHATEEERRSPLAGDVRVLRQGGEAACELRLAPLGKVLVRVSREGGLKLFLDGDLEVPEDVRPFLSKGGRDEGILFGGVLSGTYTLRVDARGWLPHAGPVDVVGGETVEVDVTLLPGASLDGTVVDGKGEPVADLRMHAATPDPERSGAFLDGEEEAYSDEEGRFLFEGLREGPVVVRLDRGVRGYAFEEVVRATAPGKGLRIVVRRN